MLFQNREQHKICCWKSDSRKQGLISEIVNFKEKAGGTEWIIAILMGEVVAQDLN